MITVNPKELFNLLVHALKCKGVVPMVHGSPGISKSAIARRVAKHYNLKPIDWRGSSADPTDTNGLPFRSVAGNKAEYLPFDTFPVVGDAVPKGFDGWLLCMEELNSAPRAVQAACYKILLDRLVGNDKELHPNVKIICLGNLMTDGAIVNPMGTALQSRLVHIELASDIQESQSYMIEAGFDNRIIAYSRFRPSNIHKFDPKHKDKTFACIRTWEFCDSIIKGVDDLRPIMPLVCGAVSEGVGREFVGFCEVFNSIPNLDSIVKDPRGYPVPHGMDICFALATALVEHITADNLKAWVTFVDRMNIEHKLLVIQLLFKRDAELALHDDTNPLVEQVRGFM